MTVRQPSPAPISALPPSVRLAGQILTALLLCGMLAGCDDPVKAARAAPPRPVMVEAVKFGPGVEPLALTGAVHARYEIPMAFRVAGKIEQRLVDAGARVKAGDVLARLESNDYRLALAAAEADVRAAEAEQIRASAEAQRTAALLAKGHAPQATMDKVEAALRAAQERLTSARSQRELAANRLRYTDLRADADGLVLSVSGEPEQVVAEGRPVFTVAHDGAREVVVAVPESRVADIASQKAEITLWALPGRSYAATLRELAPEADAATRTYLARFMFADATPEVAIGMTARVTLMPKAGEAVALVPTTAVWWRGEAAFVWVVGANDKLTARAVTIARLGAERSAITGALVAGERIVTMGVHRLEDQQPVRIADGQ